MLLTKAQCITLLTEAGVPKGALVFKDARLQTVSDNDVTLAHHKWMQTLPVELRDYKRFDRFGNESVRTPYPKWLKECWDCDNHSLDFMTFICRSNAYKQATSGEDRGGIAFGHVSYKAESNRRSGWHAANVFIGHNEEVYFFEPADNYVINLSKRERESIRCVLFA